MSANETSCARGDTISLRTSAVLAPRTPPSRPPRLQTAT